MSVKIPSHFDFGVGLDLHLSGIPTNYNFGLDLKPINVNIAPLELKPLDLSFRIKEIPSIRAHFPVDYKVCIGLFGIEALSLRLCGQSQVITEPYVPNPCECRG